MRCPDANRVACALRPNLFMDARPYELFRCHFFFLRAVLNETPSRIATLRMRSGVRFMIRAASSKDFDALASSITRRSSANDHDLGIGENAPFKRQNRQAEYVR